MHDSQFTRNALLLYIAEHHKCDVVLHQAEGTLHWQCFVSKAREKAVRSETSVKVINYLTQQTATQAHFSLTT